MLDEIENWWLCFILNKDWSWRKWFLAKTIVERLQAVSTSKTIIWLSQMIFKRCQKEAIHCDNFLNKHYLPQIFVQPWYSDRGHIPGSEWLAVCTVARSVVEQEFQKVTNAGLSRYRVALTARANVLIINNLRFLEADSVQATIQNDQHPPARCFFSVPL